MGWETPEKVLSGKVELLNFQVEQFQKAMDDDINTPGALAVLFELAKELRRQGNILVHEGKTETSLEELQQQWVTLVNLAKVLGLEVQPDAEIIQASDSLNDAEIESLIQQRLEAKKAKNYAEADPTGRPFFW